MACEEKASPGSGTMVCRATNAAPDIEAFIEKWGASGGSEKANHQPFVIDLCALLGVAQPNPTVNDNTRNDYVFERRIDFTFSDGTSNPGWIDCYKRDCFILEAKQSRKRWPDAPPDGAGEAPRATGSGGADRGWGRGWDRVLRAARKQAEDYARALPVAHGYPPFLLVVDVGRVIEIYADFSGQGKNYAHFPDKQNFRLRLEDLRDEKVRARLRAIWTAPHSLDPARHAAEVTRDVAARLARIARRLEADRHDPEAVARFLMRCLFTMFAEDIGLLPDDAFTALLAQQKETPETFPVALEQFWAIMDKGGYALHLNATLKRFNGILFKERTALPLDAGGIEELYLASQKDWSDVEPAIFGTLLERALSPRERGQLGAHYTPRVYVERLVIPTVIEPLRAEWLSVHGRATELREAGAGEKARQLLRNFLHRLARTRVLDPACGTGNFLYVALELMKRLEGEVLGALEELGDDAPRFAMSGETVDPSQFHGLEVNPRAVPIADLVLWIGYLKWQIKTGGLAAISEPVLHRYGTIRQQDAVLAWRETSLRRDNQGQPITVWDGRSYKDSPVTGHPIPDASVRLETYTYTNPRPAEWPEAEFIVGNPPFIGGKDLRAELGDGYAEALWAARPDMPGGADFVMHFWDKAATILRAKGSVLRRFGFITTNSVTQTFSRRVIERHLNAKDPLSLVFAVPDHPWLKQSDKAAVRIAMTVAEKGGREGVLARVAAEDGLNTDAPIVDLEKREGKVLGSLTLGADLSLTRPLLSNEAIASPGVKLHGNGFIIGPDQARGLGLGQVSGLEAYIRPYRNGRDIAQRPRGVMVIDLYPLGIDEVQRRFPAVYQHVKDYVKPARDQNKRASYRENWWVFGEPRSDFRAFSEGLPRYITTVETAKHRFFQFLDASVRPDNMLVNIGLCDAAALTVLSSRIHVAWMLAAGGTLEDRPRYNKSRIFDPFPFPRLDAMDPALRRELCDLGERLDGFRKERLRAHADLTLTGLYNVLERVRGLENGAAAAPLSETEKAVYEAGLVGVLKELHDGIDRAVFQAYGWADLIEPLLGAPGATTPSPHKRIAQEAAEQDLLGRLVTLNQERAAGEARGAVHWLRPNYQRAKLAHKVPENTAAASEAAEMDLTVAESAPKWPSDGVAQIRMVHDLLRRADKPLHPETLARAFHGRLTSKRRARVAEVLETLKATGTARPHHTDPSAFFVVG